MKLRECVIMASGANLWDDEENSASMSRKRGDPAQNGEKSIYAWYMRANLLRANLLCREANHKERLSARDLYAGACAVRPGESRNSRRRQAMANE